MLTSAGEPEDVARCRKLGISAYLTKPVKQSELFDILVSVISEPVVEKPKSSKKPRTRRGGLHVLLAEDNRVNQLVATRILEKLGHQVTVVSNGREAVSVVRSAKFDVIAMDVQMPEMDGLEATTEIRRWERTMGTHIPIIALTAHAMKGDRERCLEAGMDGYTSKPIRINELEQAIAKFVPAISVNVPVSKSDEAEQVIDHGALLEGFDGDRRLLNQIVRLFLADYPRRLAEIKEAINRGDGNALAKAAHALKGSVGNFAAKNAFVVAQRLETIGRNRELQTAGEEFIALESELALVSKELRRLARNSSQSTTKAVKPARRQGRTLP
jgi:CheY-like chemotaxis protein/HPt (histidine-containing phosphotransfer) domain-containing protein